MFKTYIPHYTKLVERKINAQNQLDSAGITDYEFIKEFDKEDLNLRIINKYYNRDPKEVLRRASITLNKHNKTTYDYPELSLASVSLCMKHIVCLDKFIKSDSYYALILEDDFNFTNQFNINDILIKAPSDWDIIFIGGAFDHGIISEKGRNDNYILADHPATNTTSSFIYNRKSAVKTRAAMQDFCLPIDWELNYNFHLNDFNVYHTVPYVANQLSGSDFQGTVVR